MENTSPPRGDSPNKKIDDIRYKITMIKIGKFIATITGIWLLSIALIWISNSNKVAIVVTDWGQPEGFSDSYYQGIALRSRIGIKANSPSEACTEYFAICTNMYR